MALAKRPDRNSVITLNKEQCNNTDLGIFLAFDVSRSGSVVALVIIIVGAFGEESRL
jgi:hypothetical protein